MIDLDGLSGDPLAVARQVLRIEAEAIHALADRLGPPLGRAVELVAGCQGRVVVTGLGKSGLVAKKLAATLAATGTPAIFLHPVEGRHGDLGMLVRGDLVVAVSNSGETDELLELVPAVKRLGLALLVITGRPGSRLAQHGDLVLDASVAREACPFNLTPTASSTAAQALGDALAVAVLTRRGLSPDDVARLHPGGAIGRRLTRVEELMHRGDDLPVVRVHDPLAVVVRVMTAKGLGSTAVVDEAGTVVGIVTDGDLRRALGGGRAGPSARAADVMTARPRTVGARDLAAAALELMERFAITQLLIVDGAGRLEGLIHLHDLLRAKLA